jgi:hypothetical protein
MILPSRCTCSCSLRFFYYACSQFAAVQTFILLSCFKAIAFSTLLFFTYSLYPFSLKIQAFGQLWPMVKIIPKREFALPPTGYQLIMVSRSLPW